MGNYNSRKDFIVRIHLLKLRSNLEVSLKFVRATFSLVSGYSSFCLAIAKTKWRGKRESRWTPKDKLASNYSKSSVFRHRDNFGNCNCSIIVSGPLVFNNIAIKDKNLTTSEYLIRTIHHYIYLRSNSCIIHIYFD